jgi:hypothetical protein
MRFLTAMSQSGLATEAVGLVFGVQRGLFRFQIGDYGRNTHYRLPVRQAICQVLQLIDSLVDFITLGTHAKQLTQVDGVLV